MRYVVTTFVLAAVLSTVLLSGCSESETLAKRPGDGRLPAVDDSLTVLPEPLPGVWSPVEGHTLRPFWRKGDRPTYAPPWYANRGDVTAEIAMDQGESPEAAGQRLYDALQHLGPGDHILIREGTYSVDRWLSLRAPGTAERPIIIRGADGENVTITRPDAEKNVIDIDDSRFLALVSLQIRGGSNAIKIYRADHLMLYDLNVARSDGAAITANADDTSYLSIVDCEISQTGGHGEAIYLGRPDGSKVTHHTAVVGNYIHDLVAPSVNQGDGIEVKQGSYAVWIKYNFVQNTNYPGIIVYGNGRGLGERNVIEENVVIDSADYSMQAAADAVIRNNLIVNSVPRGRAFVSKVEPAATPQNLLIVNNTILARGRAFTCRRWDGPDARGIVFANNAIYSHTAAGLHGSLGHAAAGSNMYLTDLSEFREVDLQEKRFDVTPRPTSRLRGAGDPAVVPPKDLYGVSRRKDHAVIGAVSSAP